MNQKGIRVSAIFLLLSGLLLGACASGQQTSTNQPGGNTQGETTSAPASGEPIVIGGSFSLTGPAGIYGTNMRDAAQLVVDQTNVAGGINGQPIKFVVYDDETKPDKAVENTVKLLESDKVFALVGFTATPVVAATATMANEAKVPMSMMSGGYVIKPEEPYVFGSVHPPAPVIRGVMLQLKNMGLKNLAILNADDALGQSSTKVIKSMVDEFGLTIVAEETYRNNDVDVTAQLTNIKGKNPDVLISWATGSPMALVVNNAKQIGLEVPIVVSNGNGINQILELLQGVNNDRVIIPSGPSMVWADLPDTHPSKALLAAFNQTFQEKTGRAPDYTAAVGYDAMRQTIEAIQAAGLDQEKVRAYLESYKAPGALGSYQRSATDHNGLPAEELIMMTIRDGKFTLFNK